MRLSRWWMAALLLVGGCFSPSLHSGDLQCTAAGECPPGYHCAADHRCYAAGQGPDLGAPDAAMPDLGAMDLAEADLSLSDMSAPPDLTPVVTATPPAAAWICGAGGAVSATSGNQLAVSVGGTIVSGSATATSGAVATFGYFSSDTY